MRKLLFVLAALSPALAASAAMAAEESRYGDLGTWRIVANGNGASFAYCAAETDNGQVAVRIATNGVDWLIGVPYYGRGTVMGGIGFAGIEGEVAFDAGDDGWAATRIQQQGLVELRRQNSLYIELDRGIQRFFLTGSSAAIDKAAECAGNRGIAPAAPPVAASGVCAGGETSLPVTGLCPEQATAMIGSPVPAGDFGDYYTGCTWSINETPFPGGDYLLYYAAECKGRKSLLEFAGGAHFAELTVVDSAYAAYSEEPFVPTDYPLVRIAGADGGDPQGTILALARSAIEDPARAAMCNVYPGAEWGYPADAFIVDVSQDDLATLSEDERMSGACGPFGLGDSAAFWRVFQGFSWFFDLGQDAYQDIDAASLTLVTADGKGGWKRFE